MTNDAVKRWRRKQLGVTAGTTPDGVYGCWSKIKTGWRTLTFLSDLDGHTTGKYQWSRGTMARQGYTAAGNSEPAVDPRTKPGMEVSASSFSKLTAFGYPGCSITAPCTFSLPLFALNLPQAPVWKRNESLQEATPPPPPHGSLQKHLESIQRETDRVLKSWCGGTITERCRKERNVTGFTPTTQPNKSTGGSAVDSKHDEFSERWRWECPAVVKTAALQEIITVKVDPS